MSQDYLYPPLAISDLPDATTVSPADMVEISQNLVSKKASLEKIVALASQVGVPPAGPAGGDLSGNYPAPVIKAGVTDGYVMTTYGGMALWSPPTGGPPAGAAGGDLAGSYPDPVIKPSVNLGGTPTAPTANPGTANSQIATTQFVVAAITTLGGVPEAPLDGLQYGRQSGAWSVVTGGGGGGGGGPPTGPAGGDLAGNYPAPTLATVGIAGTVGTGADTTISITTDDKGRVTSKVAYMITPAAIGAAPLASPTFTGDPKAPTPSTADNDTSIATTAYVVSMFNAALPAYAPLASPVFTGNPVAPTPTAGDNDTSIATTAFVTTAIAAKITNKITVGTVAPGSPATNDLWVDTN